MHPKSDQTFLCRGTARQSTPNIGAKAVEAAPKCAGAEKHLDSGLATRLREGFGFRTWGVGCKRDFNLSDPCFAIVGLHHPCIEKPVLLMLGSRVGWTIGSSIVVISKVIVVISTFCFPIIMKTFINIIRLYKLLTAVKE